MIDDQAFSIAVSQPLIKYRSLPQEKPANTLFKKAVSAYTK